MKQQELCMQFSALWTECIAPTRDPGKCAAMSEWTRCFPPTPEPTIKIVTLQFRYPSTTR